MKKIAFIDIDTQFDFMKRRGRLYVNEAEKIIFNLKRLTKFAEINKIPVISSIDVHSYNDAEFKMFPAHCVKGTAGQKKIKETLIRNHIYINSAKRTSRNLKNLLNKYNQIILEKNTFDVFSNPNTKVLLKGFDVVFVYGVATDYCIRAASLSLLKLKKKVNLIVDAIKPVSVREGQRVLTQLKSKGIKLIKTKNLIRQGFVNIIKRY
jgi:nicotinamidase/pyrazinamidase